MSIAVMKQALEALKRLNDIDGMYSWVDTEQALRQAIEQAEKQFNPDWDQQAVLVERIRELEAQQALDKKSDNARELGLDYEPDPVAWVCEGFGKEKHNLDYVQDDIDALPVGTSLYTAPPRKESEQDLNVGIDVTEDGTSLVIRRGNEIIKSEFYKAPRKEWVGLTDDEIKHYNSRLSGSGVAQEIEAKLRERNT
jgi:hypothetical protein